MSNTAALLGNFLTTKADKNYYIQQQIYWSNKYEANSAKLAEQVKYEEKWCDAFDDAQNIDKECKLKSGEVVKEKGAKPLSDKAAAAYATDKVAKYKEDLSLHYADLDIEYDTMKCMYDSLLEQLTAQEESEKAAVSAAAQDTGLLGQ